MKRFFKSVRLNSEFKRVQRLPLLTDDPAGLVVSARAIPATPSVVDAGLALLEAQRVRAEISALKCTHSY